MSARRHVRRHLMSLGQVANPKPARLLKDADNPLETLDDFDFASRFRLSKLMVLELLNVMNLTDASNQRGLPVPSLISLLICLRFYATGSFQLVQADLFEVSQSTVSRIVSKISRSIALLRPRFIKLPSNSQLPQVRRDFYRIASFPGVSAAIDCTHVRIENPGGSDAELFRNRKGYFSLNVQMACDSKLNILSLVVQWPGSVHDSRIFLNSSLCAKLEANEFSGIILGDNGYPNKRYLLTPVINPQNESERRYNISHIATRNTIERMFGVLKRRFPCLRRCLKLKLQTNLAVVVAACTLHNFLNLRQSSDLLEEVNTSMNTDTYDDPEDQSTISQGDLRDRAFRRAFIQRHFS